MITAEEIVIEESGEPRLDVFLARTLEGLSRTAAQRLIEDGLVLVNGAKERVSYKLQLGDRVSVRRPQLRPSPLTPQDIPLDILFQDEHLAVIFKPAGLVVHPAAGHDSGTLVNALLHHLPDLSSGTGIGGELRPGIVHRIDRNTSGVLLITKTDAAHQALSTQFKEHSITRRYQGLCWGKLPLNGEWDAPIGRDPKERKRMAIVPEGRRAVTRFRALEYFGSAATLFEAELLTGRTHQVRVHFASHGFPLAGDSVYAAAQNASKQKREAGLKELRRSCPAVVPLLVELDEKKRQFLHAEHLAFTHPATGQRMEFSREAPEDLREIVVGLRSCKI
ncbi:MAG: RluA family pseudouridine synthase [Bdellovibrionota bacterium]